MPAGVPETGTREVCRFGADQPVEKVSDRLEQWFGAEKSTLGGSIDAFRKSFAVVFIVLMAVPALRFRPGVTHVLEAITMLLALELIVGRRTIWLPARWKCLSWQGSRGWDLAHQRIPWFEAIPVGSGPSCNTA